MITNYRAIDGWFDYEVVFDEVINELTERTNRKIRIVEVGAWFGKSSFYLVDKYADRSDIFIVDTWMRSEDELQTAHKVATERDIFIDFMKNMKIHFGKFTPVRSFSVNAATIFEEKSIDFIFLDGDHTYQGVKSDIVAWLPKLRNGGILAGHDYTLSFQGVKDAVNELIGRKHIRITGRSWVYHHI